MQGKDIPIDLSDIPEITDFTKARKNPYADKLRKHGYSIAINVSPEDIAKMTRNNIEKIQSMDMLELDPDERRTLEKYMDSLPSKEFESMLSMRSLYDLEYYSNKCNDYFSNLKEDIDVTEISVRFPAFVADEGNRYILYIKYPTYKILILDKKYSFSYSELELLIEQNDYHAKDYFISINTSPVIIDRMGKFEELPCTSEILCLRSSLRDNELLVDTLSNILKKHFITHDICPTYYLKPKNVNIKAIGDKKFIQHN